MDVEWAGLRDKFVDDINTYEELDEEDDIMSMYSSSDENEDSGKKKKKNISGLSLTMR